MNCEWLTLTSGSQCVRCGLKLKRDYDDPPICECRPRLGLKPKARRVDVTPIAPANTFLLGDEVERILTGLGITKDRYLAVKEAVGLPATCGCDGRKEEWNEWSRKVASWWRSLGESG